MESRLVQHLHMWTMSVMITLTDRLDRSVRSRDDDRGDVPGWVMITVMTAIVVIALLAVFKTEVTDAVKNAFDSVSGAGKN